MSIVTAEQPVVNEVEDQIFRRRARWALRRMLVLIDELAVSTRWLSVNEITQAVNERLGVSYIPRTYERDLFLLESEELVESRSECPFGRFSRTQVRTWRLLKERSEGLQEAAIKLDESLAPVEAQEPLYAILIRDENGWQVSDHDSISFRDLQGLVAQLDGEWAIVPCDRIGEFLPDEEPTRAAYDEAVLWKDKVESIVDSYEYAEMAVPRTLRDELNRASESSSRLHAEWRYHNQEVPAYFLEYRPSESEQRTFLPLELTDMRHAFSLLATAVHRRGHVPVIYRLPVSAKAIRQGQVISFGEWRGVAYDHLIKREQEREEYCPRCKELA